MDCGRARKTAALLGINAGCTDAPLRCRRFISFLRKIVPFPGRYGKTLPLCRFSRPYTVADRHRLCGQTCESNLMPGFTQTIRGDISVPDNFVDIY
jgi:hypothetical protein